jgi:hypothetical protein
MEREEKGESKPKRRKSDQEEDEPKKNKRSGRPPNNPGPPRRHAGSEVPIVPRPSLHLTPEMTKPLFAAIENDNYEDALSQSPAVNSIPPLILDAHTPLEESAPPFPEAFSIPATPSPQTALPSRNLSRRGRGQQPISLDKLGPMEKALGIKILSPFGELGFDVVVSPHYNETFVNPRFAPWIGTLTNLHIDEINRISTPRGWLRCTRSVAFPYYFPSLGQSEEFFHVRARVLNDNDPDIGVAMVIGRPWIEEHNSLNQYVYDTAEPASNAK